VLEGSIFRTLRQGQRVVFELDGDGRASDVRIGSEVDMGLPGADVLSSTTSDPYRGCPTDPRPILDRGDPG